MSDITIILLGFTGDLAKRKLIPAMYDLIRKKKLEKFNIVGAALEDMTVDEIIDQAQPFITGDLNPNVWDTLRNNTYYRQLDFADAKSFVALNDFVTDLEKKGNFSGNRLVYLAVASEYFCSITEELAKSGLVKKLSKKDTIWQRIVYEKPFGHDLQSAKEINDCIAELFNEDQIYRIDHYLTKELVGNIALVRFTNCVFEPLWNHRYIDNVQIILSEKVCVGDRGRYYDKYGAIRDVVQNHMLELMALIGMEAPERLSGNYIRDERVKVLEKIKPIGGFVAQYENYKKEKSVKPSSKTETYVQLKMEIDNPRWKGVPFYLKTGKCLDKKETVIHIKFKQVDCLFLIAEKCPTESNWLTIRVTPQASFSLRLNAKKPGMANDIMPVDMEFCHSCLFGDIGSAEDYVVLFEEIMRGEQSISVRFDEIEYAWKVIDKVNEMKLPMYTYKKGSKGPKEMNDFMRKHGMRWRS